MKTKLIVSLLCLPVLAFGQNPIVRNFFTTNTAPVVDVIAGSNTFVTPTVAGQARHFTVDSSGAGGSLPFGYQTNQFTTNVAGTAVDATGTIVTFNGPVYITNGSSFLQGQILVIQSDLRPLQVSRSTGTGGALAINSSTTLAGTGEIYLGGRNNTLSSAVHLFGATNVLTIDQGYVVANGLGITNVQVSGLSTNGGTNGYVATINTNGTVAWLPPTGTGPGSFITNQFTTNVVGELITGPILASNLSGSTMMQLKAGGLNAATFLTNGLTVDVLLGVNTFSNNHEASVISGGYSNRLHANKAFIGGGGQNQIGGDYCVIGGGSHNVMEGGVSEYSPRWSIIGGGAENRIVGIIGIPDYASIGGGWNNEVSRSYSAISGGVSNQCAADNSFIGGGYFNQIGAPVSYASILGGYNSINNSTYGVVGGGFQNINQGTAGFLGGGRYNAATTTYGSLMGGYSNTLTTLDRGGFIGGGEGQWIDSSAWSAVLNGSYNFVISNFYSTIAGGYQNALDYRGGSNLCGFIGAGYNNTNIGSYSSISSGYRNYNHGDASAIGAGKYNTIESGFGVIGGGASNTITASNILAVIGGGLGNCNSQSGKTNTGNVIGGGVFNTNLASMSVIAGGASNLITGEFSLVSGGLSNTASGDYSAVLGGISNVAYGQYSLAAGRRAVAADNATFVWSDGSTGAFVSTTNNQVSMLASNGFRFIGGPISGDGSGLTNLPSSGSGFVTTNTGYQYLPLLGSSGVNWWGVDDTNSGQYLHLFSNRLQVAIGLDVVTGGITNLGVGARTVTPRVNGNTTLDLGATPGENSIQLDGSGIDLNHDTSISGVLELLPSGFTLSNGGAFLIIGQGTPLPYLDISGNWIEPHVPITNASFVGNFNIDSATANVNNDLSVAANTFLDTLAVSNSASFSNTVGIYSTDHNNQILLNTNGTIWISNRIANVVPLRIDRYVAAQTTNLFEVWSNGRPALIVSKDGFVGIQTNGALPTELIVNGTSRSTYFSGSTYWADSYFLANTPAYFGWNGRAKLYSWGTGIIEAENNSSVTLFAVTNGTLTCATGLVARADGSIGGTLYVTNGATFGGPAYSTSTSTSAPAANELATAEWVRGLFSGGNLLYNCTNANPYFTNMDVWYSALPTTNSLAQVRTYNSVTTGQYLGTGIASTQRFTTVFSPMTVNAYLSFNTGGGRAVSVQPEFYYCYTEPGTNGPGSYTNLLGDYVAGPQALIAGTNLYSWVIPFPTITSTNSAGFWVIRRFKVTSQNANPNVSIHGSGNTPSTIGFQNPAISDPSLGTRGATNITYTTNTVGSYDTTNRILNVPYSVPQPTNSLVGPTNFINMALAYADLNMTAITTITNFGNVDKGKVQSAVRFITNSTASDLVFEIAQSISNSIVTTDGLRKWTVTNKSCAVFSVTTYGNASTNAVFRNLW